MMPAGLKKKKYLFPELNSSYDDVPFHWLVLAKVTKLALIREQLYAYRLNRPGSSYFQIKQHDFYRMRIIALGVLEQLEPGLLTEFYKSFIADMDWIKNVDKSIKNKYLHLLNSALRNNNLDDKTKKVIEGYLYRQTIKFKA
jgi:hypothetical protein